MSKPPKIPLVAWRDGRPRFVPGAALRALGYKGEDLRHGDGTWYSVGEATDWSLERAAEIQRRRVADLTAANRRRPKGARPLRQAPVVYSFARLFEDWQRSPRWGEATAVGKRDVKAYALNTRNNYRQAMKTFEKHDPEFYHAAVAVLTPQLAFGLFEDLWEQRGLSSARAVMATLSAAISWGRRRGRVTLAGNPCIGLGLTTPEPRVRFGTREEIAALVATADALGRPEIGDMVMLGVWTGQRQNDRLALVAHKTELARGRRVFRQKKTGAIVEIFEAPELKRRLVASRKRREVAGIVDPQIVLDERQWRPFKAHHYRHTFGEIRDQAAAGIKREGSDEWRLAPCPSLADFHDQDLRDTAVTWMGFAGATIAQICSVTGHSAQSAHTILKHYLAQHPDMADTAIGKMVAWFDEPDEGESE
ncbi:hypothetical protein GTW51_10195 [Aurantimonas aggregata]|uniref:Integrase n=1 Tax=Aurantimonas aggregata TaxID=2047720 RepID=A0A6L9MHQ0_9HYPH|nr:hypothetical protein [Aurantimonas aggregata]NDV87072.1 hypothetical protein [Aurantimonas aggregata]